MRKLASVLLLGIVSSGLADDAAPHGGQWIEVDDRRCELVWQPDGVRVYLCDRDGEPIPAGETRGLLLMTPPGRQTAVRLNLFPIGAKNSELVGRLDLGEFSPGSMKVELFLSEAGARVAKRAKAELAFGLDPDAVGIARQMICPVTGTALGEMGKPPKAVIAGRTVYVCCEPCIDMIREEPEKYFAKLGRELPKGAEDGMLIVSTDADQGAIAEQGNCPVMDVALGKMGTPWKMTVNGRTVYLCCKGCAPKVKKNPEKYLGKIKE